jgi:uracil-DNA glycosylase
MRDKPEACYASGCPLAVTCRHCERPLEEHTEEKCADGKKFESLGRGFVLGTGDPAKAKFAFVLEAPGREELSFKLQAVPGRSFFSDPVEVQRELATRRRDYPDVPIEFLTRGAPVVGQSGAALFGWILPKAGIKRDETVYLDNTLRCFPPKNAQKQHYPTGEVKKGAERCCRQWDRLEKYRPDTVVFGLHPAGILREITPLPLAVRDAERVRDFTAAGHRVLALLGGKAAQAFARYGSNISKWRGHYFKLAADWTETYKQLFDHVAKKPRARKKVNTDEADIWGVPQHILDRAKEKTTRPDELSPVACKSFKRYQGKRPPKCGCDPCWTKFEFVQKGTPTVNENEHS